MKIKLLFLLLWSTCAFSQLTLQTPAPLSVCDDNNDGFVVFDLTDKDFEITASLPAGQYGVAYFETMADAQNDVNAIFYAQFYTNIQAYIQTLFVRVTDFNNPVNIGFTTLTIRVFPVPMAMQPNDYQLCDGPENDGFETFDLSVMDMVVSGGSPSVTVEYFETFSDAEAGVNVLPHIYTNIVPSLQTIFVRATNPQGCYNTTTFELRVEPVPYIAPLPDILVYENPSDGTGIFDLTQQNAAILATQPGVIITYYLSESDAAFQVNPIFNAMAYSNFANPQTIWVSVENAMTGCVNHSSFEIIVTDQLGIEDHNAVETVTLYPNPADGVLNITSSGDISGISVFDVGGRLISAQIANGPAAAFDFQPYASGIYFVKVATPAGTQTRKVVRK
jgi:hypothetical protein